MTLTMLLLLLLLLLLFLVMLMRHLLPLEDCCVATGLESETRNKEQTVCFISPSLFSLSHSSVVNHLWDWSHCCVPSLLLLLLTKRHRQGIAFFATVTVLLVLRGAIRPLEPLYRSTGRHSTRREVSFCLSSCSLLCPLTLPSSFSSCSFSSSC
jgi:hypothetical protein